MRDNLPVCYVNTINWSQINNIVNATYNLTFDTSPTGYIAAQLATGTIARVIGDYVNKTVKPECSMCIVLEHVVSCCSCVCTFFSSFTRSVQASMIWFTLLPALSSRSPCVRPVLWWSRLLGQHGFVLPALCDWYSAQRHMCVFMLGWRSDGVLC